MRWLGLLVFAGCKFSTSLTTDDGGMGNEPLIDAPPDTPPDAFDDKCFASGAFYFCLGTKPTGAVQQVNDINTTMCNGANQEVVMIGTPPVSACAVAGASFTVDSGDSIDVTGTRPLVIVGDTSIVVSGSIDASSFDTKTGPGANPAACAASGNGGLLAGGGGGGAGGTFGTRGGDGGTGSSGVAPGGVAPAASTTPPDALRGGCKGGQGLGGLSTTGTAPGNGGGAVLLVSRGTITINSIVDASGGGADGGPAGRNGGGGAGSGGMIVFHAQTLVVDANARIFANGGGGGGGAGTSTAGDPGSDPMPPDITMPALGGQLNTAGASRGGNGAAGTTNATPGANGSAGGGGGGGGHGVIRVPRGGINFPAGTVSPAPIP